MTVPGLLGVVVGTAVLALSVLVLAALFVPLHLDLRLGGNGRRADLSWGFGLVAFDLLRVRQAGRGNIPASNRRESRKSRPKRRRPQIRKVLGALASEGLAGAVARLLVRLVRAVHPQGVRVAATFGLEEPCDTGLVWGLIAGPLAAALARIDAGAVIFEPDFRGPALRVDAQGRFTVFPAQVLAAVLLFALTGATLRAALVAARG